VTIDMTNIGRRAAEAASGRIDHSNSRLGTRFVRVCGRRAVRYMYS
jgi:hypothetical protein